MKAISAPVFALLALCATATAGNAQPLTQFSLAEIRRIVSQGPWPVIVQNDPSNRASGNADAVALGEILFFDTRLSSNGQVSCATCHVPERGWEQLLVGVGARPAQPAGVEANLVAQLHPQAVRLRAR